MTIARRGRRCLILLRPGHLSVDMLDIVAVVACPIAFAAILTATFVLDRRLSGTALVALLAGTGALTSLLPVMAYVGARLLSPLASCAAMALGLATFAGAWIAARILPPG